MSFLKGLGSLVGEVTGIVVGGLIKAIGQATNVKFVEEVGNGVKNASLFAGNKIGELAILKWMFMGL